MSPLTVILADTPDLKHAVYRFRYEVYVEAMKRRQLWADHGARIVQEPMDASARNYIAMRDGATVGVIRANSADDPATSYYRKLYRIDALGVRDMSKVQITTKLMVRPDLKNTAVGPRLISSYADDSYKLGFQLDVIDCNRHLVPFFERIGYFSYVGWVFHKEYGTVRPLVYAPDTISYLESIGSLLAPISRRRLIEDCYGGNDLIRRVAEPPASATVRAAYHAAFAPIALAAK